MRDRIGQCVGTYRLIRLLVPGTLIDRYLGYDVSSEKQVTLLLLASQTDESGIKLFQRNLPIIKRLAHPHIAPLLDAGIEDLTPFVVLDNLPTSRQSHQFPLPIPTIVRYVWQLADALDYAHSQGIWDTYTAPETILLGYRGEALLGGFGVQLLAICQGAGLWERPVSPTYLPPELIQGMPSPAGDQYALAVVVYEWLCGVPPFQGSTPLETAVQHLKDPPPSLQGKTPTIPLGIERVVMKALSKDPKQRFATVKAFASAFAHGWT